VTLNMLENIYELLPAHEIILK